MILNQHNSQAKALHIMRTDAYYGHFIAQTGKDPVHHSVYLFEYCRPKLNSKKQGFILFSCFIEPQVAEMVVTMCRAYHFTGVNQKVYEAILLNYEKGKAVDIVAVTKTLKQLTGQNLAGYLSEMLTLQDSYYYAHQLTDICRTLILQKIRK